jgi:hypothetical protein
MVLVLDAPAVVFSVAPLLCKTIDTASVWNTFRSTTSLLSRPVTDMGGKGSRLAQILCMRDGKAI